MLASSLGPASAKTCAPIPQPIAKLDLKRFYTDTTSSRVNTAIRSTNNAITAPLKQALNTITSQADRAILAANDTDAGKYAACALDHLSTWANAAALSGPMPTKQGEHHRKWALAGLALAYLKVERWASPTARVAIDRWLQTLADDASRLFDNPGVKRNNHYYWLGLGLGAVGIAANSPRHWQAARTILDTAISDIAPDGHLPMELARGPRALHYHVFALQPLMLLDALAAAQPSPPTPKQRQNLTRLAALTLRGISNPSVFEDLAGAPQKTNSVEERRAGFGWPMLVRTLPDTHTLPPLPPYRRAHRWIGGDIKGFTRALPTR